MKFRKATTADLPQLQALAISSWSEYQNHLTPDNWLVLWELLNNPNTYKDLLQKSEGIICENDAHEMMGMAFLVPKGNPDDIYDAAWCHLRFVSVNPKFRGKGIGKELTLKCMELAKANNEQIMALHTSEIMESARYIYEKLGFEILKEIAPRLGIKYWIYIKKIK